MVADERDVLDVMRFVDEKANAVTANFFDELGPTVLQVPRPMPLALELFEFSVNVGLNGPVETLQQLVRLGL